MSRLRRLDERVLGPSRLLTPEEAQWEREVFRLDLGDGLFGLGLACVGVLLLTVFAAWQLGLLALGSVFLWWLGFLAYQVLRGRRGKEAVTRSLVYAFGWSTWIS